MVSMLEIVMELRNALSALYLLRDIRGFALSLGYDFEQVADQLGNVELASDYVVNNLSELDDAVDALLNIDDPFGANAPIAISQFLIAIESMSKVYEGLKTIGDCFSGQGFDNHISEIMGDGADTGQKFAQEFLKRTIGSIVYDYLEHRQPLAKGSLEIIGILQSTEYDADPARHRVAFVEHLVKWQAISDFLSNPEDYIKELYEWGIGSEGIYQLLRRLESILIDKMIPASLVYAGADELGPFEAIVDGSLPVDVSSSHLLRGLLWEDEATGLQIEVQLVIIPPTTTIPNPGIGLAVLATIGGAQEIHLSRALLLSIDGGAKLDAGLYLALMPGKAPTFTFQPPTPDVTRTSIQIATTRPDRPPPTILFGSTDGSRLEIGSIDWLLGIDLRPDQSPDIYGEMQVNDGKVVLKIGEGDGFIDSILPPVGIESNFDLTVGFSTLQGLYFGGSSNLDIVLPVHKSLGPIDIDSLHLAIKPSVGANQIPLTLAASIGAKIGPISATVKDIGILANLSFPEGGGNLGPLNLDLDPKWPDGVGLSIDAAGVKGGGYLEFDHDNGRYVGVLQLAFSEIGLVAITLITTRKPDGSKGFSMLSMINVTFDPAISLPYNFKLHGVGGLLGIQRRMVTDVIRDGLKNGILDSVMFPEGDIIARAPQIISDLRSIFPPTDDRYVIALMAKLSWSELVFANIGLFIEVPMPIRMAIAGEVYTYLPSEDAAIIELHLADVGVLDLAQKKLYYMASIYDSRILIFDLYGDAYLGVSWGNRPYFVLSLGGFHPRDRTVPADVPSLRRITLSLGSGNDPRITLKTYLALTSTSLAHGAKLELLAKAGRFKIEGYMGFDALIIFSPFSFEAEMGSGVAIKAGGSTLLSINLDLLLSGPTPWHAEGKAKFKIVFLEVKVRVSATWGRSEKATLPTVNPWPPLKEALEHSKSWGGALPQGEPTGVQIRQIESTGSDILVFSTGYLEIRQNVLPLGIKITRFINNVPGGDMDRFDVGHVCIEPSDQEAAPDQETAPIPLVTEPTLDFFALLQYQEMSDSEKLSSPAYEKLESGVRCKSTEIDVSAQVPYELKYETEIIDENKMARKLDEPTKCNWRMGKFLLRAGAASKVPILNSGSAKYRIPLVKPVADLVEEGYSIVNNADMSEVDPSEIPNNGSLTYVHALQAIEEYVADNPEKEGELQIAPKCEVSASA